MTDNGAALADALVDGERRSARDVALLRAQELLALGPGLHPGVSDEAYHCRIKGMASKSVLDMIARAPAVYAAWLAGAESEPTEAMRLGSATHCALLEPDRFVRAYAVEPQWGDLRKTANKEARAGWLAEHVGATPLKADDAAMIAGMVAAVRAHPLLHSVFEDGESELVVRWQDGDSGLECKARLDRYVRKFGLIFDLKTTQDASPDAFRRSVSNFRYHAQAAMYLDGVTACSCPAESFLLIAVEKSPPHLVGVYALDAEAMQFGRRAVRRDLTTMAGCLERDEWPGLPDGIVTLDLPPWVTR
jgi:hypothetical protein